MPFHNTDIYIIIIIYIMLCKLSELSISIPRFRNFNITTYSRNLWQLQAS